jgi:uracil-DNA glycosylase family 4
MRGFFPPSVVNTPHISQSTLPHCGQCGLARQCHSPQMPPTGKGKYKILFCAEAPGEQEDADGQQLIGEAGQLLRDILARMGKDLDDCWKTNAVICRPPKNVISPAYIEACRPNLIRTIKELNPSVIVLLGNSALDSLLPTEWGRQVGPVTRWVGYSIPSVLHNAWLCPTYHPSYALRMNKDELLMGMMEKHIRHAFVLERKGCPSVPKLADYQSEVEIITRPRLVRARLRDLATKRGLLAFDYETTGLKPDSPEQRIVTCSFCHSRPPYDERDVWAGPIDESCMRALSAVLLNGKLRKVASNLKFEERWTRAKLGHPVVGWFWDVMLGAHVIDNRSGITGLKFQVYTLLGIGDYDAEVQPYLKARSPNQLNRIHQVDLRKLLLYNGLDSLFEFMICLLQRRLFKGAD